MIYPPSNKIGLGVIGTHSQQSVEEWSARGANLVCKYGDQTMLPIWAANAGVDYVWRARTPEEITTIPNPLTPSEAIQQPALWWADPSPWPSGGKSEPQQWGPVGKPIQDVELVKTFAARPRKAPLWVYDAGHKPYYLRYRVESLTDLGCAAMYDHASGYPAQFALWSCWQSQANGYIGVVNVLATGVDRPTTAQRVRRNCWLAMASGAKGLLAYNVADCSDDTAMALERSYHEIAHYEPFLLHGHRDVERSNYVFPDWTIGPKLSTVSGIPKRLTAWWYLGPETLRVEIDLENDTVSIPEVTSSWRRP